MSASLVVSDLSVDEQSSKEEDVEVGDRSVKAGGETPCDRHDPITEVVGVTGSTPPSRGQELGARLGRHELEVYR